MDQGSDINFLDSKFVEDNHIQTVPVPNYTVSLGDGTVRVINSAILNLPIRIQDYKDHTSFHVLDLHEYDAILGLSWMDSVGASLDIPKRTVAFQLQNQHYTLIPSQDDQDTSANSYCLSASAFCRLARHPDQELFLGYFSMISTSPDVTATHIDEFGDAEVSKVEDGLCPDARALLAEFDDVFPDELPGNVPNRNTQHRINLLPGSTPVSRAPYRLSIAEEDELKRRIQELLDKGFISPSDSPWAAPVLFVRKKDSTNDASTLRFCVDYRGLNALSVRDQFPLPIPEDLIRRLHGATIFSKIDLRSGYYQVPIAKEDRFKTAFKTRHGLYEFNVMPFGLCNAPATFMRLMNNTFQDMLDEFLVIYIDDLLIFSKHVKDHLTHVRLVLQRLREHKLFAKRSKCAFFQKLIEYLGFQISGGGVKMEDQKLAAILAWPTPTCIGDVQTFLGLANWYRSFVFRYADIAAPLTDLTRKYVAFQWDINQQHAFQRLKQALTTAPILAIHNPNLPNVVITDASDFGYGGVFMQEVDGKLLTIAFLSKRLNSTEANYDTQNKELYAIKACAEKWYYMLNNGHHTTFYGDHEQLQSFPNRKQLSGKWLRWHQKISHCCTTWSIKYIPGKLNVIADALSRRPDHRLAMIQSSATTNLQQQIMNALPNDPQAQALIKTILNSSQEQDQAHGEYTFSNDLLYKQTPSGPKLFIPASLRTLILHEHHDLGIAGHCGTNKTLRFIQDQFYWPKMVEDVKAYIKSCEVCQRNKGSNQQPAGLLNPLPVPSQRWESISMDFIVHLPTTEKGFNAIFVVVDRLSKFAHFLPNTVNATAQDVATLFFTEIFSLHGLPQNIVSDRDPKFISDFWSSLWDLLQTKLKLSSAYHPQTDGQTERVNRVLEDMLRSFCSIHQHSWDQYLPYVFFAYNNSIHESTGYSPFFLNFGRHPRTPVSLDVSDNVSSVPSSVEQFASSMNKILLDAQSSIRSAQQRQKFYADKHRRFQTFALNDMVLLNSKNYTLSGTGSDKLNAKFVGPFKIIEKISDVAYRLELPTKIHNVFHVSQLKPYIPSSTISNRFESNQLPPAFHKKGQAYYVVDSILKRQTKNKKQGFLVKYQGYDTPEWVEASLLREDVPDLVHTFDTEHPLPKRRR